MKEFIPAFHDKPEYKQVLQVPLNPDDGKVLGLSTLLIDSILDVITIDVTPEILWNILNPFAIYLAGAPDKHRKSRVITMFQEAVAQQ